MPGLFKRTFKQTLIIVGGLAVIPLAIIFFIDIKEYIGIVKDLTITWYLFPVGIITFWGFWVIDVLWGEKENSDCRWHVLHKEASNAFSGYFTIASSFTLALVAFMLISQSKLIESKNAWIITSELGDMTSGRYWRFLGLMVLAMTLSIASTIIIRYGVEFLDSYRKLPKKVAVIKGTSAVVLVGIWLVYYLVFRGI